MASDKAWDRAWNDYWFIVTPKITVGQEEDIFRRFRSNGSQGGAFGDFGGGLSKRVQERDRRHVIYWGLNRGGKRSVVQTIVKGFEKTETKINGR